jgi:GNAT superfamily N-acetyltransferase
MRIVKVDYHNQQQGKDLVYMLGQYAIDEHGGGKPLANYTQRNLIRALQETPIAVTFIAYEENEPVGLVNCIQGFSTFNARPLLNVHDLIIKDGFRGQGIGTQLLNRVEKEAKKLHCCKVTIEVLEKNERAKQVYHKFGFEGYNVGDASNNALFWEKNI